MAWPHTPDAFGFVSYRRGGKGYEIKDWQGEALTARAIEASIRGIDEVTEIAESMARTEHPWQNRTFQTEASLFRARAKFDRMKGEVWGGWGVDAIPRQPETLNTHTEMLLTTKDVAMFLEFGTTASALRPWSTPKLPWLYPVWDETKRLLPGAVARHYRELGPMFRYKVAGSFVSWKTYWGLA